MKLKIQIKTPKGHAKKTAKKIVPFILGLKKLDKEKLKTNKADSIIIWTIECDINRALKISRNVALYEQLVSGVFKQKMVKKMIKKKFSKEEVKKVEDMLFKKTSVKILKEGEKEW